MTIVDSEKSLTQLLAPDARELLTARFAQWLLTHPGREVIYNGKKLRSEDLIERRKTLRKFPVECAGEIHEVSVQVFHWKSEHSHREVFLCSESGHPLQAVSDRFLASGDDGTVFIKSTLFDQLHQDNMLQTLETTGDQEKKRLFEKTRATVRRYYQSLRKAQAEKTLEQLREEGSYPYHRSPKSEIEKVERRVFDLCTINISQHLPDFPESMTVQGRKLLLRMIQKALTQNPSSVGKIIREVCRLPKDDARRFADLLDDVPLSKVVDAAHRVSERLQFLKAFKAIGYLNPFERAIKERTELQKIIAPNTWLFGEEYTYGTDDQDLKTVLEKHIKILGRDQLQGESDPKEIRKLITEFNKSREKTELSLDRVPDFMLWRQFKERRCDEYEFLVIEIKRPGVKIGSKEHSQIEDYALAVTDTSFADKERTRWVFIVISDELAPQIDARAHQAQLPPYTTFRADNGRYEIRAFPWSVLIQSAEARHEHLRQWLDHNVSIEDALKRTQKSYGDILPSIAIPSSAARRKTTGSGR